MDYDYSKLSGRIREKCKTQKNFAKKMSLSNQTVSCKMKNKREWSQTEMLKACSILDINTAEIDKYFFCVAVQSVEQKLIKRRDIID